jgi:peptidyl-prolyl cis-trans isomerase A (cyclophilin A)
MRSLLLSLFASALVLGTACQKDKSKDETKQPAKNDTSVVPKAGDGAGAARPKPKPKGEVRAPKAEDLPEYVKDLEGEGDLLATFETDMGDIHCKLYENETPMTVANFVGLARGLKPWLDPRTREVEQKPFYDGLVFHRVIPDFMIQGGDPLGVGRGGPGYRFADEFVDGLEHDKPGLLSMANAGAGTNGSQFFITEVPTPHLDGKHTVWGECKEVDIIKRIAREGGGKKVTIQHVEIPRGKY